MNFAPKRASHYLAAVINTPCSFTTAQLLGLDKDADKDALTLCAIDTTGTNGGTVVVNGSTITYTPPPNYAGSDSLSYSIADPFGGMTNCTLNVTVGLGTATSAINNVVQQPDGNQKVTAFGVPGQTYMIQASTNMINWEYLTTNMVPATAVIVFYDLTATNYSSRYYRLVTPR